MKSCLLYEENKETFWIRHSIFFIIFVHYLRMNSSFSMFMSFIFIGISKRWETICFVVFVVDVWMKRFCFNTDNLRLMHIVVESCQEHSVYRMDIQRCRQSQMNCLNSIHRRLSHHRLDHRNCIRLGLGFAIVLADQIHHHCCLAGIHFRCQIQLMVDSNCNH